MIPGDLSRFRELWRGNRSIFDDVLKEKEVFWVNPDVGNVLTRGGTEAGDARDRLSRFAPFIMKAFPETTDAGGIIESELREVPFLKKELNRFFPGSPGRSDGSGRDDSKRLNVTGRLFIKLDSELPVSGSIKARGGIYAVLKHAEALALENGLLSVDDDYSVFGTDKFRDFFSGYTIAVGSTGNLGLSIGIIGSALGFRVTVHMSSDAKAWKKEMLRSKGVEVREYKSDYSRAVAEGRRQAEATPKTQFIDDENSKDLFLGYAAAAFRLEAQLKKQRIHVDGDHPLFVYLPCGVGGGPGGITLGLKLIFSRNVHCFFAEPTAAPCMLLGLATGLNDGISVSDVGLSGRTEADGLAVGRSSGIVGRMIGEQISGVFTVEDSLLFKLLAVALDSEGLRLEPSALAGMAGPWKLLSDSPGLEYLQNNHLDSRMRDAAHIIWATGGGMVPDHILDEYYEKGSKLL